MNKLYSQENRLIKRKSSPEAAFLSKSLDILCRVNGVAGTHIDTGGTISAFGGVNHHITVNFRDRALRAFAFASAAIDTIINID
jgi:hypothetical protein